MPSESRSWYWGWTLLLLAVFGVAISGESLWIDEALTATKAALPSTLGDWWQRLASEKQSSDLQMPLYMFLVWAQAKFFGSGEWALRALNLPWMVAGGMAFILSFAQPIQRIAAGLVLLTTPFAWYYLNEARPYAMQLGSSLLIVAALQALSRSGALLTMGHGWFRIFCVGLLVLGGIHMFGMIWIAAAVGALVVLLPFAATWRLLQQNWTMTLVTVGGLILLTIYYLWTLKMGARASAVAGTGWANVAFAGYELAGFTGLGPGRLQLREQGVSALRPYLGWLVSYGVVWSFVMFRAIDSLKPLANWRRLLEGGGCVAGPVILLVAAGMVAHFRLLGRHLTPLAAVWIWLLTLGFTSLAKERAWSKRGVGVLFLVLGLVSCLSLRFAPRHARDDYRGAATRAQVALAQGHIVWWSAARAGAEYYRLPASLPPGKPGTALELINAATAEVAGLPMPDLVVVSKPDLHDAGGAVAAYLATKAYKPVEMLPGFTIWGHAGRQSGTGNAENMIEHE
jgi:hypothetical protein